MHTAHLIGALLHCHVGDPMRGTEHGSLAETLTLGPVRQQVCVLCQHCSDLAIEHCGVDFMLAP